MDEPTVPLPEAGSVVFVKGKGRKLAVARVVDAAAGVEAVTVMIELGLT